MEYVEKSERMFRKVFYSLYKNVLIIQEGHWANIMKMQKVHYDKHSRFDGLMIKEWNKGKMCKKYTVFWKLWWTSENHVNLNGYGLHRIQ